MAKTEKGHENGVIGLYSIYANL